MADFTAEQRRQMAREGSAMADGSFPVRNASDLANAVQAVGRASNNSQAAVKQHIIRRARALGLVASIPDSWSSDGATVTKADAEIVVPIFKDEASAAKQIVYGIVLEPDLEDSQGDIVGADDIEKAAHGYLVQSRRSDVQHTEVTLGFGGLPIADVVESFIAPHAMTVADRTVRKGAWVMGMRVNDPDVWQRVVKGELTGYSIGGSGIRKAIASS